MPGPRPCHCCPFIFCIVGRGLDPSAAAHPRGASGTPPPTMIWQGFSLPQTGTAAWGGVPSPRRSFAAAARFRVIPHKKAGVRTLALPCRSSYCNALISPPAAPPARPFPRRCGSPPRRKFRRRGLPAHRGRSPRRGGRAAGAAPCSPALPAPCGRRPA